jgi:hypothetical protein
MILILNPTSQFCFRYVLILGDYKVLLCGALQWCKVYAKIREYRDTGLELEVADTKTDVHIQVISQAYFSSGRKVS